MKLGAQYVAF